MEKKHSKVRGKPAAAVMAVGQTIETTIIETGPSQHRKYSGSLSICPLTIKKKYKSDYFLLPQLPSQHTFLASVSSTASNQVTMPQIDFL